MLLKELTWVHFDEATSIISGVLSVSPSFANGSGFLGVDATGTTISWGPHRRRMYCGKLYRWGNIKGVPLQGCGRSPILSLIGLELKLLSSLHSILKHSSAQYLTSLAYVPATVHCMWGPNDHGPWSSRATWRVSNGHRASKCKEAGAKQEEHRKKIFISGL